MNRGEKQWLERRQQREDGVYEVHACVMNCANQITEDTGIMKEMRNTLMIGRCAVYTCKREDMVVEHREKRIEGSKCKVKAERS